MTSRARGFTLLEMGVVILIIAYLTMMGLFTVNAVSRTKYSRARADALTLYDAIWGSNGRNGYFQDVGALPPKGHLEYLMATRPPTIALGSGSGFVSTGWHGPYLIGANYPQDSLEKDPWGTDWNVDELTGAVSSAGPDRIFGNADDIVVPPAGTPTPIGLGGTGVAGIDVVIIDPRTRTAMTDGQYYKVVVNDPDGAGRANAVLAAPPTAGLEAFTVTGLHPGRHLVTATHQTNPTAVNVAPDYGPAGSIDARANVVVDAVGGGFGTVQVVLR